MTNHAVTVKDSIGTSTQIYSNGYSQQQVIKNFVHSMANTKLDSRLKLDEAVKACSGFNSLQEVIDKMVADCRAVNDAKTFLRDYCGIFTENNDTGAITGWDVGGLTMKTAKDLMPENSAAVYPESTIISSQGLTLTLHEKSSLNEQEQLVIQGLNSWWLQNSVKLIEESYGLSFNDKPYTIPFFFEYKPNDFGWAWGGPSVSVNMAYTNFKASDKTGGGLDGALVHEFTHVLQCNFNIWSYMPNYMVEGMANLTGGSDGYTELAGNADSLAAYLNIDNNFSEDGNVYTVGYLFWRYLMKQASDSYNNLNSYAWKNNSNIVGTADADFLTGNGEQQTIFGGNGNDTVTAYGKNSKIYGDSGEDYIIIGECAENLTIVGGSGNDSIENFASNIKINSGSGDDYILNKNTNTIIDAGEDNDNIKNYNDSVTIDASTGNDIIINGEFFAKGGTKVSLSGGNGEDTITNSGSYSILDGSAGNDLIHNGYYYYEPWNAYYESSGDGAYDDSLKSSYTTISGGAGNDSIYNRGLNSVIDGGAEDDNIKNYANFVTIAGNIGNDIIINGEFFAKGGTNLSISGGDGADTITNSGSYSVLDGGAGNDLIHNGYYYYEPWNAYYESSSDSAYNDNNGSSNVTIISGTGDDSIYNRGENVIYKYYKGDGNDIIFGYLPSNKIQISGNSYTKTTNGNNVIIQIDSGSMTLMDAKDTAINIETISSDTLPIGISIKNSILTASTTFIGNEINLSDYPTATKVNAAALTEGISILGGSENNSIKGSKGADTISGGNGNDTVSLGSGKDVYIYEGGNDLIQDYKTGEDKIKLSNGSITSASVSSSNVILNVSNGGKISLKGGKDKAITVINEDGKEITQVYPVNDNPEPIKIPVGISVKSSVLTASSKFTGNKIDLAYHTGVKKINASAVTQDLNIVADASANSIKGGKGADTINGGASNDTLTGGAGNDLFVYEDGNDVITDYKVGEDKIKIGTITNSTVKSSNVILTTSKGTLTVKNAKDKIITLVDNNGNTSDKIFFSDISYSPLDAGLSYDAKRTVLTANNKFTGKTIDLSQYLPTITKVNSSATSQSINIVGNSSNNSVKAGKGSDTISGGDGKDTIWGGTGNDSIFGGNDNDILKGDAGNDTLNGGRGNDTLTGGAGNDVFVYEGGNDIITDYSAGQDSIKVSGTISNVSYNSKHVIFTIGNGSLTINNAKGKNITVSESNGSSHTYSRTLDLFYDNNFLSDDFTLDSVVDVSDTNYSVEKIYYSNKNDEFTANSIVAASSDFK